MGKFRMRKSANRFERSRKNNQGDLVCGRLNCSERSLWCFQLSISFSTCLCNLGGTESTFLFPFTQKPNKYIGYFSPLWHHLQVGCPQERLVKLIEPFIKSGNWLRSFFLRVSMLIDLSVYVYKHTILCRICVCQEDMGNEMKFEEIILWYYITRAIRQT